MTNKVKILLITIILIAVIALNVLVRWYTDNSINDMETKIDELKQLLLDGNYEESKNKSEKIRDDWDEYENKFAYFMDHEEIEKLSVKVAAIAENATNKEYELALEDSVETKFLLEHVKDKLRLKLNNVF